MNRINVIFLVLTVLLASVVTSCQSSSDKMGEKQKPNIVVVLADDMRWDYLGVMSENPLVETPNLDRLATKGTLFNNAFVTSSICTPSRTSILTGMYERKHGVTFGANAAMTEEAFEMTYPMLLRKNGYYTGWVGKNHTPVGKSDQGFGYKSGVMDQSFDYWLAGHGHLTFYPKERHDIFKPAKADNQLEIIQEVIDGFMNAGDVDKATNAFFQTKPEDKPFCLMVNVNVPHSNSTNSMQQRSSDPDLYKDEFRDKKDQLSLPDNYVAFDEITTPKLPDSIYNGEYLNTYDWVKTEESLKENQIRTLQTMKGLDQVVGNILKELEIQNQLDNTLILFTSDHGLHHGEFGLGGKTFLYDIDLRVPMIIYAPGLSNGKKIDEMVLNIDIAPTLLDFGGVPIPEEMQGESIRPLMEQKKGTWRTDFFSENLFMGQNYPRMESVRNEDWKYIRYYSKGNDQPHILALISPLLGEKPIYEELYNIKDDPNEELNLASNQDNQNVLESLRKRCDQMLLEAKDGGDLPSTHVSGFKNVSYADSVRSIYNTLK